jgi:hypothetical protein
MFSSAAVLGAPSIEPRKIQFAVVAVSYHALRSGVTESRMEFMK